MNILSAKYANAEGTIILAETDERGQVMVILDGEDVSNGVRPAYEAWLKAGHQPTPFEPIPVDPIELAEAHIGKYFSTPKLLQMKVWWDAIPHEGTPKLAATFAWTAQVTGSSLQGATEFALPPFPFAEVVAECASQLAL
jgi:hypothetical protein